MKGCYSAGDISGPGISSSSPGAAAFSFRGSDETWEWWLEMCSAASCLGGIAGTVLN